MFQKTLARLICGLLVAALLFPFVPDRTAAAEPAAVLYDHSFEDGTMAGWSKFGGEPVLSVSQAAARTGSKSLQVANRIYDWQGAALNLKDTMETGGTYTVTFYVYQTAVASQNFDVLMNYTIDGIEKKDQWKTNGYAPQNTWKQISFTHTMPSAGQVDKLEFYIRASSGSLISFYIDDITITGTPRSVYVPIFRSSLEDGTTDGWSQFGNTVVAPTSQMRRTGDYALKVSNRAEDWQSVQFNLKDKMVNGGKYKISFYVAHQAAASQRFDVLMNSTVDGVKNGDQWITGVYNVPAGQWAKVEFSYSPHFSGELNELYFYAKCSNLQDFYIDDISITGTAAPEPVPGQLDLRSDFEDGTAAPWTADGGSLNVTTSVHHGGASSMAYNSRPDGSGPVLDASTLMLPEQSYRFSLWMMQNGASAAPHAGIRVEAMKTGEAPASIPVLLETGSGATASELPLPQGQWVHLQGSLILPAGSYSSIRIIPAATNGSGGGAAPAIYLDDFRLSGKTGYKIETNIPDLKQVLAADFPVGAAVDSNIMEGGARKDLLLKHFNSITPENGLKFSNIHPQENTYLFESMDNLVNFAYSNNIRVRGHTLVWNQATPSWVFHNEQGNLVSREVLLARMKEHIETVIRHFGDKIYAWDVVNEAADVNQPDGIQNNLWKQIIGPDYIEYAFRYAREANPNLKLFYNDYDTEVPERRAAIISFLTPLVQEGLVDGIGLQTHINLYTPTIADLNESIQTFSAMGLDVQITEMDVSVYTDRTSVLDSFPRELSIRQGHRFKELFDLFRANKDKITGVTFWNLKDDESWLNSAYVPRPDFPLLFDKDFKAKLAYWAIVDPSILPVQIQDLKVYQGSPSPADLSDPLWSFSKVQALDDGSQFRMLWDAGMLNVLLRVKDVAVDAQDQVSFYVDQNNSKSAAPEADDLHVTVSRTGQITEGAGTGVQAAAVETPDGYVVKASIPLAAAIGVLNGKIGFDVKVKNGSIQTSWNDKRHDQDTNPANYGIAQFAAMPKTAEIVKGTPVIGQFNDSLWARAALLHTEVPLSSAGATADFKAMWDETHLYFLVNVTDPVLNSVNSSPWEQDSVEFFIDENNGKTESYEADDAQYRVSYNNFKSGTYAANLDAMVSAAELTPAGYRLEVAIPLQTIQASAGNVIGFDLQVNDANASGARQTTKRWNDATGSGWQKTAVFGMLRLTE